MELFHAVMTVAFGCGAFMVFGIVYEELIGKLRPVVVGFGATLPLLVVPWIMSSTLPWYFAAGGALLGYSAAFALLKRVAKRAVC